MKTKLFWFGIFCGIILVFFLFDFILSKQYAIELIGVSPDPIVMDGSTPVNIQVKLIRRGGEPVEGHDIYALSLDGGQFQAYRKKTGSRGRVSFTYFPYLADKTNPLHDIRFEFRDESNSVFIEVNAKNIFTISAVEGRAAVRESAFTLKSIFGEQEAP
ncbi:MAG: hypothetical protein LBE10_12585 [Treponema sp.]|jgi:hypothetical protein|nr:hypothetical protein [Treponema sp.]